MFNIDLAVGIHHDMSSEEFRESLLNGIKEAALGGEAASASSAAAAGVEAPIPRKYEIRPYCKLTVKGILLNATKKQLKHKWKKDIKEITKDHFGQVQMDFGIGPTGTFYITLVHSTLANAAKDGSLYSPSSTLAKDLADFLKAVRESTQGVESTPKELEAVSMSIVQCRQFIGCRFTANPLQLAKLDKLYRSGKPIQLSKEERDNATIDWLEKMSDERMKQVEEEDKKAAEEEKRRQEEATRRRMEEIEERKKEEERLKAEEALKDEIVAKVAELKQSNQLTEDNLIFIFQIPDVQVLQPILQYLVDFSASNVNVKTLHQLGAIEYICKALAKHSAEVNLGVPGLQLLSRFASLRGWETVVKKGDSNAKDKNQQQQPPEDPRKLILKAGGVAVIVDFLKKFMLSNQPLVQLGISTLAGLCESEVRTSVANKGGIDILFDALNTYPTDNQILTAVLWAFSGIIARASEEEREKIIEITLKTTKGNPNEEMIQMHGLSALLTLCGLPDDPGEASRNACIEQDIPVHCVSVLKHFNNVGHILGVSVTLLYTLLVSAEASGELLDQLLEQQSLIPMMIEVARKMSDMDKLEGRPHYITCILETIVLVISMESEVCSSSLANAKVDVIVATKNALTQFPEEQKIQAAGKQILEHFGQ
eukprot:TRINITY_DN66494_c9_g8_i1.p1 TRINITY_DN66494_c9_g8~~TRINITY_DN66494_c9_g8_i1.p1  ORF type:complete len:702 (-),score=114.39 TRINITY_DN66494_c9_g8_i1:1609-3567(-)